MWSALTVILGSATAGAAPFWELPQKQGYTVAASLVVNLGRVEDRKRLGAAIDASYQRFWHESPYWSGPERHPGPLATAAMRIGWTHPVVFAQATGAGGVIQPARVGDSGFQPLIGAQLGVGLGISTDGWAGPLSFLSVLGPSLEGRLESGFDRQGAHAPRVTAGLVHSLNCCGYLQ